MIKKTILIFLLDLFYLFAFTQSKEIIDQLHKELASATTDTGKINAQLLLCFEYRLGNADSSLSYGNLALENSKRVNYYIGQVDCLGWLSITTAQTGNLPKALEFGYEALRIANEKHLENYIGGALNGLGETYTVLQNYPKALYYLRWQKEWSMRAKNEEALAYSNYDMGGTFFEMGRLDSAFYYEQEAIRHFDNAGRQEPLVYRILGDIAMKRGQQNEALANYQKSLRTAAINNERRALATAYDKIALFYKNINQPDSAILYAKKGMEVSEEISQKKTLMEAADLLSTLYEPKDTRESLRYLKIADAYKDSLFGAASSQSIQTLVAHEEERQNQVENDRLAYQNRLRQYALMAGLTILLLIAFFLYRNNRKEKKAKNVLKQKNEVIEQTLDHLKSTQSQLIQSEKMASLGELTAGIAHEIQNPLNFVNNFSDVNKELLIELKDEMNKGNIDDAKTIADDVIANEEKISHHGKRADAIVKSMLEHSRSSTSVKEPTDINALCDEYLRLAYHGLRAKDKSFNAQFETDFDNSIQKINVVPQDIGRVVLNLINNAFYAVNEKAKQNIPGYEPTVIVSTKKLNDKIEIKVSDNGNGIPTSIKEKIFQPFFTTKPTGSGTGLGLSLSYDIIKAHGGEIKVDTKVNEGTEFTIQLPAG